MLLVDGGWVERVPVRCARDMGADIVIAVDVSSEIGKFEDKFGLDVVIRADAVSRIYLNETPDPGSGCRDPSRGRRNSLGRLQQSQGALPAGRNRRARKIDYRTNRHLSIQLLPGSPETDCGADQRSSKTRSWKK